MANWYVNLPPKNDLPRGPEIPLQVVRSTATTWSFKTKSVQWNVVADPKGQADFLKPADVKFASGAMAPEDRDKVFRNRLQVPGIGGVEYTVTAAKVAGSGNAANIALNQTYTAWRKLYYTLNYMNDAVRDLFDAIEPEIQATYAKAFIELVCVEKLQMQPPHVARAMMVNSDMHMVRQKSGELTQAPNHVRVTLVPDLAETKQKEMKLKLRGTTANGDGWIFDAATGKVTALTGMSESLLEHMGPIEKLRLTLRPQNGTPMVPVAPGRITKTGIHEATITLTPEEADSDGLAISGTLHGKPYKDARFTCQIKAANGPTNKLEVVGDGITARFWMVGNVLQAEFPGQVLSEKFYMQVDGQNKPPPAGTNAKDNRVFSGPQFGAGGNLDLTQFASIPPKLAGAGVEVKCFCTFIATDATEADLRATQEGNNSISTSGGGSYRRQGTDLKATWTFSMLSAVPITNLSLGRSVLQLRQEDMQGNPVPLDSQALAALTRHTQPGLDDSIGLELDLNHARLAPALACLRGGGEVDVELKYNWLHSFGGGYVNDGRSTNIVLTAIKLDPLEAPAITQRLVKLSFLHELGHAMQIVRDTEKDKDGADQVNRRHYKKDGDHCNAGARTTGGTKYQRDPASPDQLCIMFHTLPPQYDRPTDDFCDVCLKQLQRSDVRIPPLPENRKA